ncbi:unnamed protein product [Onchocerca flexuosa]|uniref:Ras family protein n=1 Tax=Onchocerca flexuosa TaxID=387005 RepID=A0A183HC43_9BILA|nr:unnamed protein product [Onchocerca flexuosa]
MNDFIRISIFGKTIHSAVGIAPSLIYLCNESILFGKFLQVMLIGDSCCGKTCLLIRFKDNTFLNNNFISTVGIDYRNKLVEVDNTKVKLQIWDTAGQERFLSITTTYYRGADALLLVYDLTNRQSFINIRVSLRNACKNS